MADTVADGPPPADIGTHPLVDGDAKAVGGEPGLLDAREIRDTAGTEQHLIALDRLVLPVDLRADRNAGCCPHHLGDLRVRAHLDAAPLERAQEETYEIRIGVCDGLRKHLEDRDLAPDLGEERPEFQADNPAADHHKALADLCEAK